MSKSEIRQQKATTVPPWPFAIGVVLAVFGVVVAPAELRGLAIAIIGSALLSAGLVTWAIKSRL